MDEVLVNRNRLEALIAEASASGGSERANYQLFVVRLCEALGLEAPDMAREQNSLNDYVFERRVGSNIRRQSHPRLDRLLSAASSWRLSSRPSAR